VTLIISLLLLVGVVGGVAYMYRSGARSAGDGPRALGAPLGEVRAPVPPQAQVHDSADGLSISKDDSSGPASARGLAPPPEQPLPESAPPPPPVAAAGPPPGPATSPAMAPKLADVTPPPSDHGTRTRHVEQADPIDGLIARAARPAAARPAAVEDDAPVLIQIGAFSSERLADKEWSKAASIAPGDMAGKGKRVVPVTKDGATLYRTSITGFTSKDQALGLCARLRAAGGACFVR
jgi:hypothetical protein